MTISSAEITYRLGPKDGVTIKITYSGSMPQERVIQDFNPTTRKWTRYVYARRGQTNDYYYVKTVEDI